MTLENFTISDVPPGTEIIVDARSIIVGSTGQYTSPIPVTSVKIPLIKVELSHMDDFYNNRSNLFIFNETLQKYEPALDYNPNA
jgi:hypothetical protein